MWQHDCKVQHRVGSGSGVPQVSLFLFHSVSDSLHDCLSVLQGAQCADFDNRNCLNVLQGAQHAGFNDRNHLNVLQGVQRKVSMITTVSMFSRCAVRRFRRSQLSQCSPGVQCTGFDNRNCLSVLQGAQRTGFDDRNHLNVLQVHSAQVSTIATVSVFSQARVSFFLFFFFDLCWVLPTVYTWSESAVVAN